MSTAPPLPDGVARFVNDLRDEGLGPSVRGDVVRYRVVPATGPYAGQEVETGVSVNELQGWPVAPPHWIHLPKGLAFTLTNTDVQDCPDGWQRHSRDIGLWDMSRKPIHAWIAHVRGVLGQAI